MIIQQESIVQYGGGTKECSWGFKGRKQGGVRVECYNKENMIYNRGWLTTSTFLCCLRLDALAIGEPPPYL